MKGSCTLRLARYGVLLCLREPINYLSPDSRRPPPETVLIYKGLWDVSRIVSVYKFCIQYTKRFSLSRENLGAILCICKYAGAGKFFDINSL